MSNNEQFWQYDIYSRLVSQLPSESIAIWHAKQHKDLIVFVASLHDIKEYPYQEGNKTILGPGVVQEDPFTVTVKSRTFQFFPRVEDDVMVLGPGVFQVGNIISTNGKMFYQTCGAEVVMNKTKCIMPHGHRSNQHEDENGVVRYA